MLFQHFYGPLGVPVRLTVVSVSGIRSIFNNPISLTIQKLWRENCRIVISSNSAMHNIRPAGQMWPAEAFYLARKAHHFAFVFPKNNHQKCKTCKFWPLNMTTKNFWPIMRFELCTPDLTQGFLDNLAPVTCFGRNFVKNFLIFL